MDKTDEKIIIDSWLGNVNAIWWLTIGFSVMRIYLTFVLCSALLNFWRAFEKGNTRDV